MVFKDAAGVEHQFARAFYKDASRRVVKILGNTTEIGSGTKIPDNPYQLVSSDPTKITVASENLLFNKLVNSTAGGITCTRQSDGSVKLSGTATATSAYFSIAAGNDYTPLPDLSKAYTMSTGISESSIQLLIAKIGVSNIVSTSNGLVTFTPNNVSGYLGATGIQLRWTGTVGSVVDKTIYPKIQVGSTATSYTPYSAIDYPLPAGIKLNSVGDVRDEIDVTTGMKIPKITNAKFDGSLDEEWTLQSINEYDIANFQIWAINSSAQSGEFKGTSNRFEKQSSAISTTQAEGFLKSIGKTLYIRIKKSRLLTPDVAGFRAWLATNPVELNYVPDTPDTPTQIFAPMNIKQDVNTFVDSGSISISYADGAVYPLGRAYYKDENGTALELRFGALIAYQKSVSSDLLKPKYSPNHGLYVAHKLTDMGDGMISLQPHYSADLINWTRFTNIYYQNGASSGGGMGEVFPFKDKLIVKGTFNGSWNYAGRNYLFRYDTPTSAYTQIAEATSDGSIYPIIDKGYGFYTSYTGQGGVKLSKVSNDPLIWVDVTYRAGIQGGVGSDGKIFVVNGDVTSEFQLVEIDAATKTEKVMYGGSGLNYSIYGQLIGSTFCDATGYCYWAANTGNGVIVKMTKGSYGGNRPIATVQTNIPAPIKLMAYSPQLDTFLVVDINNVVYELPGSEITAQSVFTVVDASLGSTINSIAVGDGEFIIQSSSGIFVLK